MKKSSWKQTKPCKFEWGRNGEYLYLKTIAPIDNYDFYQLYPELVEFSWQRYHEQEHQYPDSFQLMRQHDLNGLLNRREQYQCEFPGCDEFAEEVPAFYFAKDPGKENLKLLAKVKFRDYGDNLDHPELEESWEIMRKLDIVHYDFENSVITKLLPDLNRIFQSDAYRGLGDAHVRGIKAYLQKWLDFEQSDENCFQPGCPYKRIKLGANCGRHHFEMMEKEPFPNEFFDADNETCVKMLKQWQS